MDISYGLNKNFVAQLHKAKEKYGEDILNYNGIGNKQLGYTQFIDGFVGTKTNTADASIDPNSNVFLLDMSTLLVELFKPQQKLLSLHKLYIEMIEDWGIKTANEWIDGELSGKTYLHDAFDASFKPYCYNFSMKELVNKGMFFDESMKSGSPQHLDTFVQHILEFVGYATKRQSGSVGLGDYLVWSYYFWKKDKDNEYLGITDWEGYKNQQFQMFVYALNQSWAKEIQSSFTNVTLFDRNYIYGLFSGETYPDGTEIIDHVEGIIQYEKDFLDWLKKERVTKLFTFPVLNASLLYEKNKFQDEDFARFISDHIAIWKDISVMAEDNITSVSSCCALKSDGKKLGLFNSVAGSNLSIGSIKVSTVNMYNLALRNNFDRELFLKDVEETTLLNLKFLKTHRKTIKKNIDKNLLPIYSLGLMNLSSQYSTYGIGSFSDAMEAMDFFEQDEFGNNYYTDEGYVYGEKIFDIIKKSIDDMGFDFMVNIEKVPAEGLAVSSLKKDRYVFPNAVINKQLYSNQWHSLGTDVTLSERILSSVKFDKYCSGGSMLFVNIEGNEIDADKMWILMNHIVSSGISTFNIVTKVNICKKEHNYTEDSNICPICGEDKKDEATRVVGYYTRKSKWQKERKEEDRRWYSSVD